MPAAHLCYTKTTKVPSTVESDGATAVSGKVATAFKMSSQLSRLVCPRFLGKNCSEMAICELETTMRGTCNIAVKGNRADEACGKPSVYSQPCLCDRCDIEPGYHLPAHWCAEHYDRLMNSPKWLFELWE